MGFVIFWLGDKGPYAKEGLDRGRIVLARGFKPQPKEKQPEGWEVQVETMIF